MGLTVSFVPVEFDGGPLLNRSTATLFVFGFLTTEITINIYMLLTNRVAYYSHNNNRNVGEITAIPIYRSFWVYWVFWCSNFGVNALNGVHHIVCVADQTDINETYFVVGVKFRTGNLCVL